MFESCNNLNVRTDVGRYFVARWISKLIKKKFGYDISVKLNDISLVQSGQTATFKVNANVVMDSKEFDNLMLQIVDGDKTP